MVDTIRLTGKPVADFLGQSVKSRVGILTEKGITPKLLIIRVGAREDDVFYERSILKRSAALGIEAEVRELSSEVSYDELKAVIESANDDKDIHGIMMFRPLPKHLDEKELIKAISPEKDVDGMSPVNMERIFEGSREGFAPCTPKAVIEMLKYYNVPLHGARVAVAGRSLVVGKPLAMLLLDENATVTICHSKTQDMRKVTREADVVVAAIGRANFFNEEYFADNTVVIDVGINDDGNGKICGDVDYDRVFGCVKALNPAAGGVGTITTTILLEQAVRACERMSGNL